MTTPAELIAILQDLPQNEPIIISISDKASLLRDYNQENGTNLGHISDEHWAEIIRTQDKYMNPVWHQNILEVTAEVLAED